MSFQRQNTAGRHHVKVLSAILLSAGLTLTAPSAQAEWRRAETANFIVYGEGSEADLRPHAEKLERFDAVLRRQFNRPALEGVRKLPVYLLHTRRDRSRTPG